MDSSDPSQSSRYWSLDVEGNVVLRAGRGSVDSYFRQTTERDAHGNVTALRAVSLDALDLVGDVEGESDSVSEFSNEYDGAGQLLRHSTVRTDGGDYWSYTFTHDGAGRCEVIAGADGGIERRDYDAAGRLWHRYLEGMPDGLGADSTVTYLYDDLGRLRSEKEALNGEARPFSQLLITQRDDGSFVEERDYPSDIGIGRFRRVWSRGCSELQPVLLRGRPEACRPNYSSAGDFLFP